MQRIETGNYYYGARYYDPKISVWLSVDPLAHKYPSLSPYVFTGNNPIMLVDPDGREVIPPQGSTTVETQIIGTYTAINDFKGIDEIKEQTFTANRTIDDSGYVTFTTELETTTAIIDENGDVCISTQSEVAVEVYDPLGNLIEAKSGEGASGNSNGGSELFHAAVTATSAFKDETKRSPIWMYNEQMEKDVLGDVSGAAGFASFVAKKIMKPKAPVMKALDVLSIAGTASWGVAKIMGFTDFEDAVYLFHYSRKSTND